MAEILQRSPVVHRLGKRRVWSGSPPWSRWYVTVRPDAYRRGQQQREGGSDGHFEE